MAAMREQEFIESLATALNRTPSHFAPQARLELDLGVDSLGFVEIAAVLSEFGAEPSESDMRKIETVEDLLQILRSASTRRPSNRL